MIDEFRIREIFSGYIVRLVKTGLFHLTRPRLLFMGTSEDDESCCSHIRSACEILVIFERVHQSLHRRCQACITTSGYNCEQLLSTLNLSMMFSIKILLYISSVISPVSASPFHLDPYIPARKMIVTMSCTYL